MNEPRIVDSDPAATVEAAEATVRDATAGRDAGPRRGRRGRVTGGAVAVLVLAGVVLGVARPWAAHGAQPSAPTPIDNGYPTSVGTVTRQDVSSVTPVNGTLGYADSYPVRGYGSGTLTWLPSPGQVISQGQALYQTGNGDPVVLLYGSVPDWRTLDEGVAGKDVAQLNHDLVALGDASAAQLSAAGWDNFSSVTQAGVQRLQSALGISSPSGSLSQGSVVFEPTALRVATITGSLGGPASGPVLTATSDQHVVTVNLDAAQQGYVAAGDKVTITLPDQSTTPGVISSVGAVASGSGSSATIPVTITLTHPATAGTLDQAPVMVSITTGSVSNALAVPIDALLALAGGGYAVEVVGPDGAHRLVSVTLGIFDDADELVQVSGTGLAAGQRVVVPAL